MGSIYTEFISAGAARSTAVDEKLIARAAALLAFLTEEEAAVVLVDSGVSREFAFLAVKAAKLYLNG